jgi:hypothetical protein
MLEARGSSRTSSELPAERIPSGCDELILQLTFTVLGPMVNRIVYVPSGYGSWGGNAGNVLLAFG